MTAFDRTWTYRHDEASAETTAVRDPDGHRLSTDALAEVRRWLLQTLADEGSSS